MSGSPMLKFRFSAQNLQGAENLNLNLGEPNLKLHKVHLSAKLSDLSLQGKENLADK